MAAVASTAGERLIAEKILAGWTASAALCQACGSLVLRDPAGTVRCLICEQNGGRSRDGPECGGCGKPIVSGKMLSALGKKWHKGCFVCRTCRVSVTANYFDHDGALYCKPHYREATAEVCGGCGKPILSGVRPC